MRIWFFSLVSTALISIGILTVIFFNIDPLESGVVPIFGFFFAAFLALFSIISIVYSLIKRGKRGFIDKKSLFTVVRRSMVITTIVIGLILFSALKVLNFLTALNFILALSLLEIFFTSRTREGKIT